MTIDKDAPPSASAILTAGRTLLEQHPPDRVSMEMVAAASGFSRMAVYRNFGSRAGLLTALLEHIDVVEDARGGIEEAFEGSSGEECVERLFAWWAGYVPRFAAVARGVLASKHADPDLAAAWEDRMSALRNVCGAVVERCRADGALAPGFAPDEASEVLWALMSVPLWIQLTEDAGWSSQHYSRTMAAVAVAALARGSSA